MRWFKQVYSCSARSAGEHQDPADVPLGSVIALSAKMADALRNSEIGDHVLLDQRRRPTLTNAHASTKPFHAALVTAGRS